MSLTETHQIEVLHLRLPIQSLPTSAAKSPSRTPKLKLDPLRALEPSRKKLCTVEAQRVMVVLEETKTRCEFVTALPKILNNIDQYANTMGPDLTQVLQDHKALHDRFVALEVHCADLKAKADSVKEEGEKPPSPPMSRPASRSTLGSASGSASGSAAGRSSHVRIRSAKSPSNSPVAQLDDLAMKLQMTGLEISLSFKSILRAFTMRPGIVRNLLEACGKVRSREAINLLNQFVEMREILMNRLLMTPSEINEKMRYLSQVAAQERQNAVIVTKLETELADANGQKDDEIREKNNVIRKLQNDLHSLEKLTEEEIKKTRTESEKQAVAEKKNSEGKKQKLQDDLNEFKAKQHNQTSSHREHELELRRQKWKVETEVENWIQRYDSEMGEKQEEYEEIDAIYTEEKRQLHELDERFKTLETEYKTIMDAKNKAREEREKTKRSLVMMIRAATTIQAFWRAYKVRKALKVKNKKGKKGKKSR